MRYWVLIEGEPDDSADDGVRKSDDSKEGGYIHFWSPVNAEDRLTIQLDGEWPVLTDEEVARQVSSVVG